MPRTYITHDYAPQEAAQRLEDLLPTVEATWAVVNTIAEEVFSEMDPPTWDVLIDTDVMEEIREDALAGLMQTV